ncbi:MAG: SRPBCC family protein [Anditalea sp.]
MQTYHFKTEQFLYIDIEKAWDFFSSAKNLAFITPPEMKFKIKTELGDKGIYEGMLIDYTVRPLFGVPLHWQTEICEVKEPLFFKDRQLKGPFRLWEHSHSFVEKEEGVLVKDHVKYQMRFGAMGKIAHALVVRKKIESIFTFRKEILKRTLEDNGSDTD